MISNHISCGNLWFYIKKKRKNIISATHSCMKGKIHVSNNDDDDEKLQFGDVDDSYVVKINGIV